MVRDPAPGTSSRHRWRAAWLVTWFMCCALFPLHDDGLWWSLAEGRAVLASGYAAYARLSGDTVAPGHWLSGTVAYFAWNVAGTNGLMFTKLLLAAGTGAVLACLTRQAGRFALGAAALVPLCATDTFDLGPTCWDTLFVSAALLLSTRSAETSLARRCLAWSALLIAWANMGRIPLLGIALGVGELVGRSWRTEPVHCPRRMTTALATAGVLSVVCLNPVGPRVARDSLVYLAPCLMRPELLYLNGGDACLVAPHFDLGKAPMLIAWAAMIGLAGWSAWRCLRSAVARRAVVPVTLLAAASLVAGVLCPENLGLAAVLAFGAVAVAERVLLRRTDDRAPITPVRRASAAVERRERRVMAAVVAGAVLLWGWLAVGGPKRARPRLGWGIAADQDSGSLGTVLARAGLNVAAARDSTEVRSRPAVAAYCCGLPAAGAVAWLADNDRLRPHAVITRTILDRQALHAELLLRRDVEQGRMLRYRRTDGSWGGWWLAFRDRRIACVAVPVTEVRHLATFRESIFQPACVDGAVVLLASVDDARFRPSIIATLELLQQADEGVWRYTPPPAAGAADEWDFIGTLTGHWRTALACHQSDLLYTLGRRTAALRVLHAIPPGAPGRPARLARLLAAEALHEQRRAGTASLFRFTAWMRTPAAQPRALSAIRPPRASPSRHFREAVDAYLRGDLTAAERGFSGSDPESAYARFRVAFEAADLRTAAATRESFLRRYERHRLAVLVRELPPLR